MSRGRGTGQKGLARKKFGLALRRRRISDLYAQNVKQTDIAKELGISQQTVAKEIKTVLAEVVEDTKVSIYAVREEQIRRLEGYRDDLLNEWHRSKAPAKVTRQEMVVGPNGQPDQSSKRVSIVTHERVADPRFMEKLIAIEQEIAKLRGTYAPTKVSSTDPDGNRTPLIDGNILVINVDARGNQPANS